MPMDGRYPEIAGANFRVGMDGRYPEIAGANFRKGFSLLTSIPSAKNGT